MLKEERKASNGRSLAAFNSENVRTYLSKCFIGWKLENSSSSYVPLLIYIYEQTLVM